MLPIMKTSLLLLPAMCVAQLPLHAQAPQAAGAPGGVSPAVAARLLDPLAAQRQLLIAPKSGPLQAPAPVTALPVPGKVVKTTKTTTMVETPGRPTRVYETQRSVILVEDQNQIRELPYVTLPLLFVRETAELLDEGSRAALEQMARVITTVTAAEPSAVFDIEGHTSTDGTAEFNFALSGARAQRVYDELTIRHGIPPQVLRVHGYGAVYAMHPQGTEEEMQLDRRVLIVRTK